MTSLLGVIVVIFLIGIGLIAYAVNIFSKRQRKRSWSQTTGEIVQSNLDDVEKTIEDRRFSKYKYVVPSIRYTYTVNLTPYESTMISNSVDQSRTLSDDGLRALANKYSTGKKVTVYYDPNHPENAVLDTYVPIVDVFMFVLVGISVLICGLSFLYVYYLGNLQ